jgi:hypothetical protein
MTDHPSSTILATAAPPGEAVVWQFEPWREHPLRFVLSAIASLGTCAVVLALHLPFVLGAALCLCCVASFAPALAPVECRMDADGVTRRGPMGAVHRKWSDLRRAEALPAGVLLSPFATRHWLDATRGLVLPMPAARAGDLRAALEGFRGRHAA